MRERVRAAPGYGFPRVWVLTVTSCETAQGPATRRRKIGDRECESVHTPGSIHAYQNAKQLLMFRLDKDKRPRQESKQTVYQADQGQKCMGLLWLREKTG